MQKILLNIYISLDQHANTCYNYIIKRKEERWEVQQAWDKHGNFLQAQARAQKTLEGLIKQYDELLHKNWELASEEQKARIAQLRAQTDKLTGNNQELEDMDEIEGDIYGSGK